MNPYLIRKAVRHLRSSDHLLANLINRQGPCLIKLSLDNPFHALTSSIISQQLSAHAARAIKTRLFPLLHADHFTPDGVLALSAKAARSAGLSQAKIKYLRNLAIAAKNGVLDFSSLGRLEDEEVIAELISFSGIGRWTAEMFLIFALGRPDVLSTGDAGLRRACKVIYNLSETPSADEMTSLAEPWRPYRSIASWYLWRVVDP